MSSSKNELIKDSTQLETTLEGTYRRVRELQESSEYSRQFNLFTPYSKHPFWNKPIVLPHMLDKLEIRNQGKYRNRNGAV